MNADQDSVAASPSTDPVSVEPEKDSETAISGDTTSPQSSFRIDQGQFDGLKSSVEDIVKKDKWDKFAVAAKSGEVLCLGVAGLIAAIAGTGAVSNASKGYAKKAENEAKSIELAIQGSELASRKFSHQIALEERKEEEVKQAVAEAERSREESTRLQKRIAYQEAVGKLANSSRYGGLFDEQALKCAIELVGLDEALAYAQKYGMDGSLMHLALLSESGILNKEQEARLPSVARSILKRLPLLAMLGDSKSYSGVRKRYFEVQTRTIEVPVTRMVPETRTREVPLTSTSGGTTTQQYTITVPRVEMVEQTVQVQVPLNEPVDIKYSFNGYEDNQGQVEKIRKAIQENQYNSLATAVDDISELINLNNPEFKSNLRLRLRFITQKSPEGILQLTKNSEQLFFTEPLILGSESTEVVNVGESESNEAPSDPDALLPKVQQDSSDESSESDEDNEPAPVAESDEFEMEPDGDEDSNLKDGSSENQGNISR